MDSQRLPQEVGEDHPHQGLRKRINHETHEKKKEEKKDKEEKMQAYSLIDCEDVFVFVFFSSSSLFFVFFVCFVVDSFFVSLLGSSAGSRPP
jgi:hypothetical protein